MKKFDYLLAIVISVVLILLLIGTYKLIVNGEINFLKDQNQKLEKRIIEKDLQYRNLEIEYRYLKNSKDSIIYDIDTLIKVKHEKIDNLKQLSADSILLIYTNYVSDKSNL